MNRPLPIAMVMPLSHDANVVMMVTQSLRAPTGRVQVWAFLFFFFCF